MKSVDKCGICGENHSPMDCDIIQLKLHVVDKPILPKARLTLPDELELRMLANSTYTLCARYLIERGTQFGPFQAKKLCTLLPMITFPLKIFSENDEELSEYYLDTTNEQDCNWMMFVEAATDFEEQNLICFQDGDELLYATIKDIKEGEQLKVWYSPYYATKMNKDLLKPNDQEEDIMNSQPIDVLVEQKKNVTARVSWSCKFCGKVESKVTKFASHLSDHYKAKLRKICEICKSSFFRRQELQKHMKIVHGSNLEIGLDKAKIARTMPNQKLNVINESKVKDSNVGGPLLLNGLVQDSLDNCSLIMPQTEFAQFELNGIDNQNNLLENLSLNVDSLLNENVKGLDHFNFELNESENEQLVCDVCLKSFHKLKQLILHLQQHTGKYTCLKCNTVFTRRENFKFHACNSYYNLKCPTCDKLFYQKKCLTHHIKYVHNKEFTCEVCHRHFECQKKLKEHACSGKPTEMKQLFSCKVCSKLFTMKRNLWAHLKLHEGTNEKYTCPICNATLSSRKTYIKHEKIHYGQGHKCDECNRIFARQDALKIHKEMVHLKKTVSCEICMKEVNVKLLKLHMTTHQDQRDYNCTTCSRSFKFKHNLARHINTVHTSSKVKALPASSYSCPKCNTNVKLRQSLIRHMKKHHPGDEFINSMANRKTKKINKNTQDTLLKDDDLELDLKQTIENMNFNTDEINNCTDINFEIDKLLNNASNIDSFLSESNDRLVESLIDIAVKENHCMTPPVPYQQKDAYLSMPDLTSGN